MMDKTVLAKMIGENIRDLRKERGLSQAKCAEWSDIPQGQLWSYESGLHLPSIKALQKICKCLGVSSTDILGF